MTSWSFLSCTWSAVTVYADERQRLQLMPGLNLPSISTCRAVSLFDARGRAGIRPDGRLIPSPASEHLNRPVTSTHHFHQVTWPRLQKTPNQPFISLSTFPLFFSCWFPSAPAYIRPTLLSSVLTMQDGIHPLPPAIL